MTIIAIHRDAAAGGTEWATSLPEVIKGDPPTIQTTWQAFPGAALEAAIRDGSIPDVGEVEDIAEIARAIGGSLTRLALPDWRPEATPVESKEDLTREVVRKREERAEKASAEGGR